MVSHCVDEDDRTFNGIENPPFVFRTFDFFAQESDIQEIMGPVLGKMFVDEAGMAEVFAVSTPAFNNWQR